MAKGRTWVLQNRADAYAELDHPADLFLEIMGNDLPKLFENALFALYDHLAELQGFQPLSELVLYATGASVPDTLRALLSEAIYRFETESFVAVGAEVEVEAANSEASGDAGYDGSAVALASGDQVRATAALWGEKADKSRHVLLTEVKAVTYHQLVVSHPPGGEWRARVLFDV